MALEQPGAAQRAQTKFIIFENFEKMNTQSIRQSLPENQLSWLENLQPIAGNNLTTVPAPAAAALALIGETISTMFYAALNEIDYFVAFTTVGSAYLIQISNGLLTKFATAGTFSSQPDVTTWEATRLLIADKIAGYSTFDGKLYVSQGGVSPNITVTAGGSGYGTAPTVTISGGSGTGATAVATVQNGSVIAVTLTNPGTGYQATDTLTVAFGTSPGSGATATVTMTGSPITGVTFQNLANNSQPIGNYALVFTGGGGVGVAGFCTNTEAVPGINAVSSVTITSQGIGYSSVPTIETVSTLLNQTVIFPNVSFGTRSVASITLGAGGTGYTAAPAVTIIAPDGIGSGAVAVATEVGGSVNSVSLVPSPIASITIGTGGNYTAAPGVYPLVFTGGGGTGAAGTATIATVGGVNVVVSTTITNTGANYTSSPTVTVTASVTTQAIFLCLIVSQGAGYDMQATVAFGTGSGATAIAHVWPFINSNIAAYAFTTIAVFQGRVWLGGGPLLTWSGTGATYGNVAYDDFLAADASASLIISDADLIHAITALRSLNNYLFIMGDQSVKQIGNISLNSAGNVTLFTILTLSSDQGTIYPKSCISYNRVFLFANTNGIYGVFGSSVQKLSDDMDGIFKLIDFTQPPQGALADINAIHNAVFLVRYKDPVVGSTRSIMLAFNGKKWFVVNQGAGLTAVATSASLSTGQLSLFGSSGPDVTNLLMNAGLPVPIRIQSSLTHHGNAVQGKKFIRAGFSSDSANGGVQVSISLDTESGSNNYELNVAKGFSMVGGSNDANAEPLGGSGAYLGLTITGDFAGFTMDNLIIEYQETALWKGS